MAAPDVTVVVAVYNTMPELTTCLTSLVGQTIGRDRMEIVAVDDGSTDGSAEELDRFAQRYPDLFTVIHQENSGGPAAPSNRGLDRATGRYVIFVGADDYLGREALQRLVSAADELGSDVVLGKMVGVNGRYVHQEIFATTQPDVGLFDSALPFSLANTKLFRRDLIEQHRLRFPEDMPVGSDQPFTLEACFRAGRISVLADYDYYYAVRRDNAHNITYSSQHDARLRCVESLMSFTAGLVEPGQRRDAVLHRHFTWELAKLLRNDFLALDPAVQERVFAGVKKLAIEHLSDGIRERMPAQGRVRVSVAKYGELEDLVAVIRTDVTCGGAPVVFSGGRAFAAYPPFHDDNRAIPDHCFDITDVAASWVVRRFHAVAALWESRDAVSVDIDGSGLALEEYVSLSVGTGGASANLTLRPGRDGEDPVLRARFPVGDLVADRPRRRTRRTVRIGVTVGGESTDAALRGTGVRLTSRLVRRGPRSYRLWLAEDAKGRLAFVIEPLTLRWVVGRLRRALIRGGK